MEKLQIPKDSRNVSVESSRSGCSIIAANLRNDIINMIDTTTVKVEQILASQLKMQ